MDVLTLVVWMWMRCIIDSDTYYLKTLENETLTYSTREACTRLTR